METSDWKEKEHLLRESLKLKSIRRREETLRKMYKCQKKSKRRHAKHPRHIFWMRRLK